MSKNKEYTNQLYPVLDFINQYYQRSIHPKELEGLSFYSYRNLQRIFKSLFGETIGAYQKRIRLENAAKLLHYSTKSITEIGTEVGYADLQAFRKAFKKQFGAPPSEVRPNLLAILENLKKSIEVPLEAIQKLNAEVIYLPAIEIVYHQWIGAYNTSELDKVWELLFESCDPKILAANEPLDSYGLVYDDPDITIEHACRYKVCLPAISGLILEKCEIPIGRQVIGNRRYMRFVHQGAYEKMDRTYDIIFGGWLLQNECNFLENAIIEHFYYNEYHTSNEDEYQTFIYIPF